MKKMSIEKSNEIFCNIEMKAGIIKLTKIVTKMAEFLPRDKVK